MYKIHYDCLPRNKQAKRRLESESEREGEKERKSETERQGEREREEVTTKYKTVVTNSTAYKSEHTLG